MTLGGRFTLLFINLLRGTVRLVPLAASITLARVLGRIIGLFCPRDRTVAEAQFMYVLSRFDQSRFHDPWLPAEFPPPRLPPAGQTKQFVSDVFAHTGEALVEAMMVEHLLSRDPTTPNGFRFVQSKGQEIVSALVQEGRGAIALSAHIGCFELLAAFHIASGCKVSVVGRSPNYESLNAAIRELRDAYGVESLYREDPSAARKIMKALHTGRVVAALIDQDTKVESIHSKFFGLPAATPNGLLRFALRLNVPILTSFIVRTGPQMHCVVTRRIEVDPQLPDAEARVLAVFHEHLENLIVRFPDQWLWWHRRWRRQPEQNTLPSTSEYLEWLRGMQSSTV